MSNNIIQMKVEGSSKSHSRTDILARDVECVIDEPIARGGTNLGLSPTETLISSLIGCTNVITHRILEKMGFKVFNMDIEAITKFNRDGVGLLKEVEVPFPEILLNIEISTDASEVDINEAKKQLSMFCPIAKVIRNSGTIINENWIIIS
ncbi:MAG: OsmC family protein [Alphaproteobacteria bacterium]|jgi:putative redox protein|nr:OsmC family protein [Alphaproteobacteria bacterium]